MTNTDACMACGHHLEAHRDGGCIAETFQCLCRGFEDFIDPDYPEGSEVTNTDPLPDDVVEHIANLLDWLQERYERAVKCKQTPDEVQQWWTGYAAAIRAVINKVSQK